MAFLPARHVPAGAGTSRPIRYNARCGVRTVATSPRRFAAAGEHSASTAPLRLMSGFWTSQVRYNVRCGVWTFATTLKWFAAVRELSPSAALLRLMSGFWTWLVQTPDIIRKFANGCKHLWIRCERRNAATNIITYWPARPGRAGAWPAGRKAMTVRWRTGRGKGVEISKPSSLNEMSGKRFGWRHTDTARQFPAPRAAWAASAINDGRTTSVALGNKKCNEKNESNTTKNTITQDKRRS